MFLYSLYGTLYLYSVAYLKKQSFAVEERPLCKMKKKTYNATWEARSLLCKIVEYFKDKYSCILGVIILLCNNPVTLLIRVPDKREY